MIDGGGEGVDLGIPGLGPAVLVGRGGFGLIYRASQLRAGGGPVAVKLVQGHLDRNATLRFERETSALGALRGHPNICTVYDAGVDSHDRPYLVMELATSSLAERIASDGPLPWEEAVSLGVRLAGALETAHRSLLLHRDVKPENVLLTSYGEWRLADFGLAQLTEDTVENNLAATPSHAAPELIEGAPPSAASDIYALGSTLFAALTGKAAFAREGDSHVVSVYKRIAEDPVPDMPGVPEEVAEVVRKAMAKAPADRHATAADLGLALQRAQERAGVAVTALPLPTGETIPTPEAPTGPEPTVDERTPAGLGNLTETVHRGGRTAPGPEEPSPSETTPPPSPNRRMLVTAGAVLAAVVLLLGALALRSEDDNGEQAGSGGTTTTTAPTSTTVDEDLIRLADVWSYQELSVDTCMGADAGPCPDLSSFMPRFTIDCPPFAAPGGFGRSVGQAQEGDCQISLLQLEPTELFIDRGTIFATITTDTPPGRGLLLERGPACEDTPASYTLDMTLDDPEVQGGRQVITRMSGQLTVSVDHIGEPFCGSYYNFDLVMQEES